MISEKIKDIVFSLYKRTLAGEVNWASSGMDPKDEDYTVNFPSSSINIFRTAGGFDNNPGILLNIINNKGDVVFSDFLATDDPEYHIYNNIINTIRSEKLNVAGTLEDIRNSLKDSGSIGQKDDSELPF
jgi:hypothetical protein